MTVLSFSCIPLIFFHLCSFLCRLDLLNDDLEGGFAHEGVAIDGERDVPWRLREFVLAAAEEDSVLLFMTLAKREAQVLVLHLEGRAAKIHVAGDENRLRIAVSKGLEEFVAGKEIERKLRKGDLRIIDQPREALFLAAVF